MAYTKITFVNDGPPAINATALNQMQTQYDEAKADLDAHKAESAKLNSQGASLVEKMLGSIKIKGMYAKKDTVNNGINVGLCLDNEDNSVIQYQFRYNDDGLLLLRGVLVGVQSTVEPPAITLNGTFNTNNPPNVYTETAGDSFTFSFTGTGFKFKRYLEDRGGAWEFALSDGSMRRVSCYNATAGVKESIVFDNLPYGTYTAKAAFIGDDPVNPPSSSPSRGYLYYNPANPITYYPITPINDSITIDTGTAKQLISINSIPDFAVSARPYGKTYNFVWVPEHASVSGVSVNPYNKVIIDGIVKVSAVNELPSQDYYNIESFEIIQSFKAFNPNGADGNMWEHYVSHRISKDKPYLEILNRLKMLQDTEIGAMYLTMLPVNSLNVTRLVLNNGVEYDSIPADGSVVILDKDVSSAMFAGEYTAGHYYGCAVDASSYTEAIGARHNGTQDVGLLTFRTDNVAKFYLNAFSGVAATGKIFQNVQRIACVSGIRFPNTLLKIM